MVRSSGEKNNELIFFALKEKHFGAVENGLRIFRVVEEALERDAFLRSEVDWPIFKLAVDDGFVRNVFVEPGF